MKKLLISIAILLTATVGLQAQTTTYTGQIKDLALNPVTSGQVTFTLAPSTDSTLPGTGRFTPRTVTCIIRGDGTLASSSNGVGACTVASNTSLSPAGTSYRICIQAGFASPGSCFYDYATGGSKDISTVAPTLQTGPLNYNGTPGPPGKDGPAGAPGTITSTGVNGSFFVPGHLTANVNRWESPLTHGVVSNQSPNTVLATGIATSGSLALSASSDFVVNQGVMISHAGAACGSVKGGDCVSAPTPTVSVKGAGGTTHYAYQLACIDGLGGIGPAGSVGSTSSGNANFAATIPSNEIAGHYAGDYNSVSWAGTPACFEVAIYRNGTLIASEYSAPSGTMTYNDTGVAAWVNRDLPAAPPTSAINDNYIGFITAIGPTTATVSPVLGASISGATLYHSDTPLIQAAINTPNRGSIDLGAAGYLVNYPINFTKGGGDIRGGNAVLLADTGDIFMDLTGGYFNLLSNFNLNPGPTNPSSIGFYCSRDTTVGSDSAQQMNTDHLIIANILSSGHALGGRGSVGYYNHGCEIQQHQNDHIEADRLFVFTSTNIDHVSSLFDAHDDTSNQSMSAIDVISMTGGTVGTFAEIDNAYSINFTGGYALGGPSTTHPYAFEFDTGESGRITVNNLRVEQKGGAFYLGPNTQLREPFINMDLYRDNETEPGIYMAAGASLIDADEIRIDDYGASSVIVPIIGGAAGCSVAGSNIRIGVWENLGTCSLSGSGNIITGESLAVPSSDYSLNPGYPLNTGSTTTWVKLGTWVANPNGSTLDIRLYSGPGDNFAAHQQAMADLIVRNANQGGSPNLSGASLLTFGGNPFVGVKIVATGGNADPKNESWDIYVESTGFSAGTYVVNKLYSDQWINSNTLTGDPGPSSRTVLVGTIQQMLTGYSATTGLLPTSPIAAGTCSNLTATAPGATQSMAVVATPASTTQLIFGLHWDTAFVSAPDTITVPVCNTTAAPVTPNASVFFNVRVIQ